MSEISGELSAEIQKIAEGMEAAIRELGFYNSEAAKRYRELISASISSLRRRLRGYYFVPGYNSSDGQDYDIYNINPS